MASPTVATPIADQASVEDAVWSYRVPAGTFSDLDGDTLSYSATLGDGSALPAWLTFNSATRTFSGTPQLNFYGDIILKVTAADLTMSVSDIFVLTVTPVDDALIGSLGITGSQLLYEAAEEFRVNSYVTGTQDSSSVAGLSDGGWVVTWRSEGQDGSGSGIYAQRYNSAGAAVGAEFRVNSYTSNVQDSSSVAGLSDGGWVVTWRSEGQDGSGSGIYAQRYNSAGAAVGAEFRVNSYTYGYQGAPSVAGLSDGGWVIAWESFSQDFSTNPFNSIYGKRYSNSGSVIGGEFTVQAPAFGNKYEPNVIGLANGNWVVTFSVTGDSPGEFSELHSASLGYALEQIRITNSTVLAQSSIALPDGGWLVFWASADQDGRGIFGRRFNSTGNAQNTVFQVNTFTSSDQSNPSAVILQDGGWVVTWVSYLQDGSNHGVYGQRYNANGAAIGAEFKVNTSIADSQIYPSVAALADGGWIVTWTSFNNQDGSGDGIFGQRFDVNGNTNNRVIGPAFFENATLIADTSTLADPDGMGDLSWQWQRSEDGGVNWRDIPSAISNSYTLNDDDVDKVIRLKASYIDAQNVTNTLYASSSTPVINVNDAPIITSNGGGGTTQLTHFENSTTLTLVIASDPDAVAALTYSIIGGVDAELFRIDANTGALSFEVDPNYEAPADARRQQRLRRRRAGLSDGVADRHAGHRGDRY